MCFSDTIIKAKYFYQYLVEDWCINLGQMRKDGKRIIQISDTETILSKKSEFVASYKLTACANCKI